MKKQLLTESEIRKMMKFANIGALSDNTVTRLTEQDMMAPEDDEIEGDPTGAPEEVPDDMEEPAMDDLEPAPEEGGEEDAVLTHVTACVDELKQALEATGSEAGIAAAAAITVTQETGDADGLEDMGDLEGEEDFGAEMDAVGDEEEADAALEEALDEVDTVDEDKVMNEVSRRVAKRLLRLNRRRN